LAQSEHYLGVLGGVGKLSKLSEAKPQMIKIGGKNAWFWQKCSSEKVKFTSFAQPSASLTLLKKL